MNRLSDEWFTSKSEKVPLWHKIALSIDEMYVYKDGKATAKNLPLGQYRVVEVEAPYGYVLNPNEQKVTFTYVDDKTPVIKESYLGIGKNQMSRIESGKANCTIPQLYCIAQILDCSADFLLFGEEHMNYSPEMVELVNNLKMVTGRIEGEIKNSLLKTTNQKR